MGQTLAEKLISRHAGMDIKAGSLTVVKVDFAYVQDWTGPLTIDKIRELGGAGGPATGRVADMIKERWGSFEKWQADFRAAGMAARGWVCLGFSFNDMKLHNYSLDAHDKGMACNTALLLVLDVYEHAYMIDYGVKRAAYLDAYFQNIDWAVVNKRADFIQPPK